MTELHSPAHDAAGKRPPRHLLGLEGMSRATMDRFCTRAMEFGRIVSGESPPLSTLAGRVVASVFFEDSTRTRASFAMAARRLGADVIEIVGNTSSRNKGETLLDTVRNLEAMGAAACVIRAAESGAPHAIAPHVNIPIINGGDGRHEHPTQGLLDLMTIRAHLGDLTDRRFAIVGDIVNSRVARSLTHALTTFGAHVTLIGPPGLVSAHLCQLRGSAPDQEQTPEPGIGTITVTHAFDEMIPAMDGLIMLRMQFERHGRPVVPSIEEYRERYQLTEQRAQRLPTHAIVLHPGPINRGLEITSAVADRSILDGGHSVILQQVANGVSIRMAVLAELLG